MAAMGSAKEIEPFMGWVYEHRPPPKCIGDGVTLSRYTYVYVGLPLVPVDHFGMVLPKSGWWKNKKEHYHWVPLRNFQVWVIRWCSPPTSNQNGIYSLWADPKNVRIPTFFAGWLMLGEEINLVLNPMLLFIIGAGSMRHAKLFAACDTRSREVELNMLQRYAGHDYPIKRLDANVSKLALVWSVDMPGNKLFVRGRMSTVNRQLLLEMLRTKFSTMIGNTPG